MDGRDDRRYVLVRQAAACPMLHQRSLNLFVSHIVFLSLGCAGHHAQRVPFH
jgi:hypothetical protein